MESQPGADERGCNRSREADGSFHQIY